MECGMEKIMDRCVGLMKEVCRTNVNVSSNWKTRVTFIFKWTLFVELGWRGQPVHPHGVWRAPLDLQGLWCVPVQHGSLSQGPHHHRWQRHRQTNHHERPPSRTIGRRDIETGQGFPGKNTLIGFKNTVKFMGIKQGLADLRYRVYMRSFEQIAFSIT